MRISKKDMNLLLVLLGLIIFISVYLGVANRYSEKTEALQTELYELTPRLEELRAHSANLPEYEAGIDQSIANVKKELNRYPADVRPEDLILYALDLKTDVGLSIESINFSPAEKISSFQIVREGKNGETEFVPMAAMKTGFSTTCGMDYKQMKDFINYIYATKYCTTLDRLTVVYDAESGGLTSSVDISKYFVSSQDYKYVPSPVPEVSIGTDDPFKTFAVSKPAGSGTGSGSTEN